MDKTSEEKWELFHTLYQHGSNIKTLGEVLPKWTNNDLEHVMRRYRSRAHRQLAAEKIHGKLAGKKLATKEPLEEWVDFLKNCHRIQGTTNKKMYRGRFAKGTAPKDHSFLLSKTMLYAACFEDHYQSNDPDEPNYSEIYRYLSQLLAGEEPTQLRPGSAAKVLELVKKLKMVVEGNETKGYLKFLQHCPVSYLAATPLDEMVAPGDDDPSTSSREHNNEREASGTASPMLFEDIEDLDVVELRPDDPYYEVKKEKVFKKIAKEQYETAGKLQHIPGLNPLEFPPVAMMKPVQSLRKSSKSSLITTPWTTYRKMEKSLQQPGVIDTSTRVGEEVNLTSPPPNDTDVSCMYDESQDISDIEGLNHQGVSEYEDGEHVIQ